MPAPAADARRDVPCRRLWPEEPDAADVGSTVRRVVDVDAGLLADLLAHEDDVLGAYVFGSAARGAGSARSDVDVAVLLRAPGPAGRRLELEALLRPAVAPRRLDLVLLHDAPTALAYRVLRDGVRIVERDPVAMARHREQTVQRYLDQEPLRRELARGVRDRVVEGRFGR